MRLAEVRSLAQQLMSGGAIDFLDMSLWDVSKEPQEETFHGRSLLSYFTELDRGHVRLAAAGKIMSGADARRCIEAGADFVVVGRAAILHHDFPARVQSNPEFESIALPVTATYLANEGLSPAFVQYMGNWKGFVAAA
jgi:2,4-dienoyl-CoA reductase-like NADH-dependent reductase (Old Yellow Enzyme family)